MKKLLPYAFAAMVALASCAKDPAESNNGPREEGIEVGYELSVGQDALSRYEMDKGGLANVDPEYLYMRYFLEVYNATGSELLDRYVRYVDFTDKETVGTNFRVRLFTNKYKIAVWADFVPKSYAEEYPAPVLDPLGYDQPLNASAGDYFYNFEGGLKSVYVQADTFDEKDGAFYNAGRRMTRDAYSGTVDVDLLNERLSGSLNLKRPLGRVAVYAKNMDPDRLTAAGLPVPDSISVIYTSDANYFNGYSVLEGKSLNGTYPGVLQYGHSLFSDDHPVENNGELTNTDQYDDLQLITFDYLFPNPGTELTTMVIKYFSEGIEIPALETKIENIKVEANKQKRYVANPFGDSHNFDVVLKKADGTVLEGFDGEDALKEALDAAAAEEGDLVIRLFAGEFKSNGLTIDKNIAIEGLGERTIIFGENPVEQTTSAGEHYGKNPILFIEGSGLNVSIKDLTFTIKNTIGPGEIDGLTIDGASSLSLENVIFDGIGNMLPAYTPNGNLQGTCVTVLGGAELVAKNSTFERFNKNAVEVLDGSAELNGCTVMGDQYNAQAVYLAASGNTEDKVTAAYGGHAVQNGFVFHTGTTGSVTGCHFTNITFGLDKNLRRNAKDDQARAVKIVKPDASTNVVGANDETNTYTSCEVGWWKQEPDSNNAKLSDIKINGQTIANFNATTTSYGVVLDNAVESASIAVTTDHMYATYTIDPVGANYDLAVGDTKTFTVVVTPETGDVDKLTYIVEVTRPKSTDATLKSIRVNNSLVEGFAASTFGYEVTIGKGQPTAEVSFEATHAGATVVMTPENMPIDLLNGESQTVTLVVTAQDETTTETYTVEIIRAKSDNAKLADIKINGRSVDGFIGTILAYQVYVPNIFTSANIVVTKEDDNATVTITPAEMISDLEVGESEMVTIEVVAQDGETMETYTVEVTRLAMSIDATLTSIMFDEVPLAGFDPEQETYAISLAPGTNIGVSVTTASEYAGTDIQPEIFSLIDGETKDITITVTAEDNTVTKTYTVTVTGVAVP